MISHDRYMFREHSPEELTGWTKRLSMFRYMRATGGLANDGDQLISRINLVSGQKTSDVLQIMGFDLSQVDAEAIDANPRNLWSLLKERSLLAEPFQAEGLYIYSNGDSIRLNLFGASGDPYTVTEGDVKRAEILESILEKLPLDFVVPPWPSTACFSETSYPQFFKKEEE